MPIRLIVETLLFVVFMFFLIVSLSKKNKIITKYCIVWLIPIFVIFLSAVIPNFMLFVANLIGFKQLSNMIIIFLIIMLIFVCISLTVIVSKQKSDIVLLIQEISLLKESVNDSNKNQ